MVHHLKLAVDANAALGEGPFWDHKENVLYWVDINNKKICMYNPADNENKELELPEKVSAVIPANSGKGAIAALENGFHYVDLTNGEIQPIFDPEEHLSNNRFNDGKCDAQGRFWAGTMSTKDEMEQGALYCLDKDGTITKKLDKLSISNGLAWSLDNKYLYLIDTPVQKVYRFDYEVHSGNIDNSVAIIDFSNEEGFPDGMTIDEEGMLWIAHWGGARVSRWNPHSGEKIDEIKVPAQNVTSCVFGGEELNELYITTAQEGMTSEELEKYPLSGALFTCKMDIKGLPGNYYGG
ncbi:SMP-30/gluconolactonase/LRE family protein [Niallia sp. FSL R7-0271]|uniref:SMP-30/gluconolactonase/LRE family protein n=1 Tax=Niallia sp. FSL R7-0271 TaxID=2921678 RepID=UPI0030F9C2A6